MTGSWPFAPRNEDKAWESMSRATKAQLMLEAEEILAEIILGIPPPVRGRGDDTDIIMASPHKTTVDLPDEPLANFVSPTRRQGVRIRGAHVQQSTPQRSSHYNGNRRFTPYKSASRSDRPHFQAYDSTRSYSPSKGRVWENRDYKRNLD